MNIYETYCIIVTFFPDIEKLKKVIQSIAANNCKIIIVDNTDKKIEFTDFPQHHTIHLEKNTGISCAQNMGIRLALEKGAQYIWLSDQDTIYPTDFLKKMLSAAAACHAQGIDLGALAPAYFDIKKGAIQPFISHTPFTQKFTPTNGLNKISHSIASGTVIPAKTLTKTGLMQENFFIDWVDLEWCWRAKNIFGYQIIGVGDTLIEHSLGDGFVFFLGKKVSIRSPLRHHYMVRNAVHIALHSRSATVPIRLEIFAKALAWTLIFPLIAPSQKRQHLCATLTGFWDGLRNRMGQKILA